MLLVTSTSKVLLEINVVNYPSRKITENCRLFQDRIEENMSRYGFYYVHAAIRTLPFKLGQNVSLIENLTDTMLDKDPGSYNTEIPEGVVNLSE